MPRGNPNFGRDVKSPGRPPKPKPDGDLATTKKIVDDFIDAHIPEYLKTIHDAATYKTTNDPKVAVNAANELLKRRLGPPTEVRDAENHMLLAVLKEMAAITAKVTGAHQAEVITVEAPEVKELPPPDAGS